MAFVRVRRYAVLAASALLGLVLSLLLLRWVIRSAAVETVPVVVAGNAIPSGTTLDATMVTVTAWPKHLKPFVAAATPEVVAGRVTRHDLLAGEPILPSKLFRPGESGNLAERLTRGERGLSVVVNEMVGVDPETLIGTYVDILVTMRRENGTPVTLPVAQRLRVLGVNRNSDSRRPQTVRQLTVGVTLQQATAIESARLEGPLSALLRRTGDEDQPASTSIIAPAQAAPQRAPMSRPKPTPPPTEVLIGTEKIIL